MTESSNKPSGTGPVFFLSYPRPSGTESFQGDPDRDYVAFFHDLCSELARHAAKDRIHRLGATSADWSVRQAQPGADPFRDIAECDVFIPLHSPRYFQSDECDRELAAFRTRLKGPAGARPESILPVLWAPVSPQWATLQPDPYGMGDPDVDQEYLTEGLVRLQDLHPARYRGVVAGLARRVAEIARGRPPERGLPVDIAALPNMLRPGVPQRLHVVILAPFRGRPPAVPRPEYGEAITDWAPYGGDEPVRLADSIHSLAGDRGWAPRVVPFSEADARLFGLSEPEATVLVVDPRALDDDSWRAALERFDHEDKPWVGVVAAWNPAEMAQSERDRLIGLLNTVLERKFARRRPALRFGAPVATTLALFDRALDATANDARIRLANHLLTSTSTSTSRPAEEASSP